MIIDNIENIGIYNQIPNEVADFLKHIDKNIPLGKYSLNDDNYVNVETYQTKHLSDAKYEAHRNYIDIQLLLQGEEKIYLRNLDGLKELSPYNSEKDIAFFSNNIDSDYVTLNGNNFVLIYPHEAHAPQCCVSECANVKKVVAKVKI